MKYFLSRIALIGLLVIASFCAVKFCFRNEKKTYNSAFVYKLKYLQSSRNEKKIVLIGGSSVGWGLSGELIESKTGIKTINLGHHAGFGLMDYMPFILKNLNKEDIIIFSPEWVFYANPEFYDDATLDNLIRHNREYGIILENTWYQFKSFFTRIETKVSIHNDPKNPYRYNCINKNGDIISHCSLPRVGPKNYEISDTITQMDKFVNYFPFIKTHKTIIVFPPTQERIYIKYSKKLEAISSTLKTANLKLAGNIEENVFPDALFYDLEYHITCDTRLHRTEKLIDYLKKNELY